MTKFGIKYFLEQGFTLEQAKIEHQKRSPMSKLYWIEKGYSEKEASYKVSSLNPTQVPYWLEKGYSEEDAKIEIRKRNKKFKEYWIERGYSEEDALKQIEDVIISGNKYHIEYWIKKGYSEEDALKQIEIESSKCAEQIKKNFTKSQNRFCKEFWIKRGYSKEDAIVKAKEANHKTTENISHEKRSKVLKTYFKNMSDEDKQKKYERDLIHSKRMKEKNKTHSPIFEEYWLNKGYSLEEAKIQVSNVRYLNQSNHSKSSKIEARCLDELNSLLSFDLIFNKWIRINDKNFCVDAKYENIVIEFNGTNFHMDDRFYDNTMKNPKGVSFDEVKLKDSIKINYYKSKNYNIFIIWEYDYINNKSDLFSLIVKELEDAKKSCKEGIYWDSACIFNKC